MKTKKWYETIEAAHKDVERLTGPKWNYRVAGMETYEHYVFDKRIYLLGVTFEVEDEDED